MPDKMIMIKIPNKEDQYGRSTGSEERANSFPSNVIDKGHSVASNTANVQGQVTLPPIATAEILAAQAKIENKGS